MIRAWIASLIVVFGTISPLAFAQRPDSAGIVSQFQKALVEIFTIFRRKAAPEVMHATEIHAAQSLKTGERFFIVLLPKTTPEDNGRFLSEAFWLADTSLLTKDKVPFGHQPESAHFPINRSTEELFDRPMNFGLEWGPLVSTSLLSDFIDFQGDTLLLSGNKKMVLSENAFNISQVSEGEFTNNIEALSQLDGLISGFSGPRSKDEFFELNHSIYTWISRAKEDKKETEEAPKACGTLLRVRPTYH